MKTNLIAYCGLNCEECEAYKATINDDDKLREKVAKEWSILNSVEITKGMINCEGCCVEGKKTPFCEKLCPIRRCARERMLISCGSCEKLESCKKIKMIIENNVIAKENLRHHILNKK